MDNAIQRHLFELLKEFHSLCESKGISYVLANHSAWDAQKFSVYHDGYYQTTVMLTDDEYDKLSHVVLPESRKLIDFTLQGCEKLYADTHSAFVNYEAYVDPSWPVPGIEIVIAHRGAADSQDCTINNPENEAFSLPSSMFENLALKKLEGSYFYVFEDMDTYLKALASEEWRHRSWPYKTWKQNVNTVYFKNMLPSTYLTMPSVKKSMEADLCEMRQDYWKWLEEEYKPASKDISRYQDYLKRTEDRFNLWRKYYPIKDEILRLAAADPTDARLEKVLDEFLETFWRWEKKRLPIAFDEEIHQATLPLLTKRHGAEKVDLAIKRIPPEYRNHDVADVLRNNGIVHPYLVEEAVFTK